MFCATCTKTGDPCFNCDSLLDSDKCLKIQFSIAYARDFGFFMYVALVAKSARSEIVVQIEMR